MRLKHLLPLCLLAMLIHPGTAYALDGFKLYASPAVGGAWLRIKSMEIAKSFVTYSESEEQTGEISTENEVVGAKSYYTGGGVTPAISAGIKLFSLGLGFHFAYTAMKTNKGNPEKPNKKIGGYYREYFYSSDLDGVYSEADYGEDYYEENDDEPRKIGIRRILFELSYGLPIWRFEMVFTTRIGGCSVESDDVEIGRAIKTKNGIAGDIGMRIEIYPLKFMGIGIGGWGGFFAFAGTYEGTYGSGGGFGGNLTFRI